LELQLETFSPADTQALGELIGRLLQPPVLLLLSGDLGAGKTCLVQGVARGLGVPADEPVASPSYTLLNIHQGRCPLHHFDLYRLAHPEDLLDLGFDEYLESGVTVVEWADRIPELPTGGLRLHIEYIDEMGRRLLFTASEAQNERLLVELGRCWREKERAR